ncbi:hypothetical protein [Oceanibacterium hippocampi]|uniref:Uncharacterized protein n=1 Tax=Oceanibacterium hippocampi TaxID=745714 RepID=A0A1Y5SK39_9PROT|nr:hypothetical protein [Oceanibacterium hippocampi]SLN39687.1 hypothetical protein OCH7691_01660 [Oceanibacterium hippocampi]
MFREVASAWLLALFFVAILGISSLGVLTEENKSRLTMQDPARDDGRVVMQIDPVVPSLVVPSGSEWRGQPISASPGKSSIIQ